MYNIIDVVLCGVWCDAGIVDVGVGVGDNACAGVVIYGVGVGGMYGYVGGVVVRLCYGDCVCVVTVDVGCVICVGVAVDCCWCCWLCWCRCVGCRCWY